MAGFFNNNFTSTGTQVNLNANNTTQIGNMPVSFRPNLVNSSSPYSNNKSTVDTVGLYVQDQIIFSPKWQAIVGLRYDKFQTNVDSIKKSSTSGTTTSENFDVTNNLLSPRAGLIFKPIEPVSIYANYSISYVPRAGDQLTSLTLSNKTFDPEKFTNYEIGAKWDVNSNFALTSALYILERANVAITDPQNSTQTILVDGQETRGIELGFSGNITEKWSVFGGYAYQDGEITKQQGNGANAILKGTQLAQTPKHTFSLWNRYNINNMWGAAIGVVSRSDMYAQLPTATQSAVLPAYARLDAALFAKLTRQLRLQVNVENLTNENYVLTAHNNNNIMPGSPITGRVTLSYDF
jgi:catecholate siderophore receptor